MEIPTPKESTSCLPSEKNSLLIGEVKKFSALYDTSDPNYYVLAERNKAWLKVAANCDEPAELCHLRWKSLRKRFAKEKRKFPEILQGHRRPWALFPKMSFLTPATVNRKLKPKQRRRSLPTHMSTGANNKSIQHASDDDMLILDDNDEIVKTCKSVEMSDDEYIYETLDDPDSALEMVKDRSAPKVKATAIRSAGPATGHSMSKQNGPAKPNPVPRVSSPIIRSGVSGRIRKLTPRMQNSMMAKKLKLAQHVIQQQNIIHNKTSNLSNKSGLQSKTSIEKVRSGTLKPEKSVLHDDRTTRHVAKVNPNMVRFETSDQNDKGSSSESNSGSNCRNTNSELASSEEKQPFKMVKLRGKNPIILSPDQYADMQSFLKHDSTAPAKEPSNSPPFIKVKSVDNLNSQNDSVLDNNDNNLDIIHSVGLMRKDVQEKPPVVSEKPSTPNYSRAYSWNRPVSKNQSKQMTTEKTLADSQTNGYEIEEAWNEIKEEIIDDDTASWSLNMMEPQILMNGQNNTSPDSNNSSLSKSQANRLLEAKLAFISHQHKVLEEQNKKTLEYMKKEHDMKMRLLEAEIEFKRKQLNIML